MKRNSHYEANTLGRARVPRLHKQIIRMIGLCGILGSVYIRLVIPRAESDYHLLPLIPLFYGILLWASQALPRFFDKLSIEMLVAALTVRYVLSPVVMVLFGAYGTFGTVQPTAAGMRMATFLMLYEMICLFGVTELFAPRLLVNAPVPEPPIRRFIPAHGQIVVPLLLGVGLLILLTNEPAVHAYRIFTEAAGDYIDDPSVRSGGFGYLALILEWARLAGCLFLANWLWSLFRYRPSFVSPMFSILGFLPVFLLASRTSRTSILFPAVAAVLLLVTLYRAWKKAVIVITAGILVAVLIPMSMNKNFGDQLLSRGIKQTEMMTRFLHSYGSPVQRVADSIDMADAFRRKVPGWQSFMADTMSAIPLLGRLTGTSNETTTTLFNTLAYGGGSSRDQIVPLVGQSLYHWGFMAAPLYSVLLLLAAYRLNSVITRERRPEFIFLHTLLMLRLAVITLLGNWTNCVTDVVTVWLPLYVIFSLNRIFIIEKRSSGYQSAVLRSHGH